MVSKIIQIRVDNKEFCDSHESANEGVSFGFACGDDPEAVRGPLKVIDPTGEDTKLLLEDEVVAGAPDPDGAGGIGGGNPFAVGGETGDGGGVGVVGVDGDVEGVMEVHDDHRSAIGVEHGVGLGVAGDQNPTPALRRGHARVSLHQLMPHLPLPLPLPSKHSLLALPSLDPSLLSIFQVLCCGVQSAESEE